MSNDDTKVPARIPQRERIVAAAHAYEASEHVGDPPAPHRIDLQIGEPQQPVRRRLLPAFGPRSQASDDEGSRETTHRLAQPTRTAFSVGFGFAAGTAALRGLLGLVGAALIIGFAWAALNFLLP